MPYTRHVKALPTYGDKDEFLDYPDDDDDEFTVEYAAVGNKHPSALDAERSSDEERPTKKVRIAVPTPPPTPRRCHALHCVGSLRPWRSVRH